MPKQSVGMRPNTHTPNKHVATPTRNPRRSTSRGVWSGAVDGIDACVKRYSDPVGLDTVDLLDGVIELYEALAAGLRRMGAVTLNTVAIDPKIAALYDSLGDGAAAAASEMSDAASTVRRVHGEKIRRIEENDPRERAWDVGVNAEYMGRHRLGRR